MYSEAEFVGIIFTRCSVPVLSLNFFRCFGEMVRTLIAFDGTLFLVVLDQIEYDIPYHCSACIIKLVVASETVVALE